MDKEKFLLRLGLEIDTLKAHVNRLKPEGYTIHPLDMELLRKKATELYDLMLQYDINPTQDPLIQKDKFISPTEVKEIPKRKPTQEKMVAVAKEMAKKPEIEVPLEDVNPLADDVFVQQKEKNMVPPVVESKQVSMPVEKPIEKPSDVVPSDSSVETNTPDDIKERGNDYEPKEVPTIAEPVKTTLDLFSTVTDNLVAHKLSDPGNDNSLASRMQKEKLQNIRSAIGINEKFLFVNELFKGDLSRYNRVVDELNAMQTKQGADTYLMELKIEGQFSTDHEAFSALKEIVARKF